MQYAGGSPPTPAANTTEAHVHPSIHIRQLLTPFILFTYFKCWAEIVAVSFYTISALYNFLVCMRAHLPIDTLADKRTWDIFFSQSFSRIFLILYLTLTLLEIKYEHFLLTITSEWVIKLIYEWVIKLYMNFRWCNRRYTNFRWCNGRKFSTKTVVMSTKSVIKLFCLRPHANHVRI